MRNLAIIAPVTDLDGDGRLTALDYPILLSSSTNKAFQAGEAEAISPFGN